MFLRKKFKHVQIDVFRQVNVFRVNFDGRRWLVIFLRREMKKVEILKKNVIIANRNKCKENNYFYNMFLSAHYSIH